MSTRRFATVFLVVWLVSLWPAQGRAFNSFSQPTTTANSPAAVTTQHGRLTVPAAAFVPRDPSTHYENHGRFLHPITGSTIGDGQYYAAVELPQGATVTHMTVLSDRYLPFGMVPIVTLERIFLNNYQPKQVMAVVSIYGYGLEQLPTTAISYNPVNNLKYAYYLSAEVPDYVQNSSGINLGWVTLDYTYSMDPAATQVLTVPAAAFSPMDGQNFYVMGGDLSSYAGPGGPNVAAGYIAPLHLPNGATITRLTFYYKNMDSVGGASLLLQTTDYNGAVYTWAQLDGHVLGDGSLTTTTFVSPFIQNTHYGYWLSFVDPAHHDNYDYSSLKGVTVEYTLPYSSPEGNVVSYPSAGYVPFNDGNAYQQQGRWLIHLSAPAGGNGWYFTPVELPDGARLKKVTAYYRDNTWAFPGVIYLRLQRGDAALNFSNMLTLDPTQNLSHTYPNYASISSTSIATPGIDNQRHSYWLVWDIQHSTLPPNEGIVQYGVGVVLEYDFACYLPLTSR
jgi:hypothetical protein